MEIKVKLGDKYIQCDVAAKECKKYKCMVPHRYTHQNLTIDGCNATDQDKYYSCANRNYHGCPEEPRLKPDEKICELFKEVKIKV